MLEFLWLLFSEFFYIFSQHTTRNPHKKPKQMLTHKALRDSDPLAPSLISLCTHQLAAVTLGEEE